MDLSSFDLEDLLFAAIKSEDESNKLLYQGSAFILLERNIVNK